MAILMSEAAGSCLPDCMGAGLPAWLPACLLACLMKQAHFKQHPGDGEGHEGMPRAGPCASLVRCWSRGGLVFRWLWCGCHVVALGAACALTCLLRMQA